jgi:two-component system, chemotaxis family, CheB/CheR fusion protein
MTAKRSARLTTSTCSGAAQGSGTAEPDPDQDRFPIVGIGASAGGLDAFTQLLRRLPNDTGMAFVLVQHLDPAHASLLSEILTRTTQMPVNEVQDGMVIVPDCVYVIPPNTRLTLAQGRLKLEPRQKTRGKNMPIDGFFSSLASEWGSKAIAIVLSGSDEDGTLGLAAVKSAGGITFAQDPQSSEFGNMPQSAIASGHVDFVFPPAAIADELVKISRHPYVMCPPDAETATSASERIDSLPRIFGLLRTTIGVDFTHYKQGTLRRRIMRRMVLQNLERLEDYVHYLQDNPAEVEGLYHDILINVTSFFREPGTFEALKNQVFPSIILDKSLEAPIRIWIPGCSTGEEAYSIAISLLEFLSDRIPKPTIQIFATDISEVAIERARLGIYHQNLLAEVSPERLRRFFVKVEGGYQISKSVRELCVFARQNLISDPPFSRLDLISCRNVLIYLEPILQKKVIPIFHYALKPTGFLMLGTSESIGEFSDLFAIADKKYRIYTRKLASTRLNFHFVTGNAPMEEPLTDLSAPEEPWSDLDLEQAADRIVLNQYAPVGVIINHDLEIVQFRGQTSPYLEPAPGKASLNLLKMARTGLPLELRTAIHRAKQQSIPVRKAGLQVQVDEQWYTVNLDVIPLQRLVGGEAKRDEVIRFFLVLFEGKPTATMPGLEGQSSQQSKSRKTRQTETDQSVIQLTQELATTKEYLRSIIEAQEATNQDLKVANEEILSSNEELQSTNEELETAKEEIQATNEELSTINEELRSRNVQLNSVNSDLQNLLSSVNIPILILGGDLRIRRFTPMAEQLFSLISTDVGRPFSDIQPNINIPNLAALVAGVLDTLNTHEQEVQDQMGRWYSLRIRPYKTSDNQIDGAVIGLIDIDALKQSVMLLEESRNYATAIVETVREPLVVLNTNLRVITANQSFYQIFQMLPAQTEHRSIFELGQGEWNIPQLRSLLEDILPNNNPLQNFEVAQDFAHLGHRTMLLNACQITQAGTGQMILLAIDDITARKQAEAQIQTTLHEKEVLLREIRHRVKNNLQVISSLLSLQSNRVTDPQASQILQDSQSRVQAIALMHEILHQSPNLAELNFGDYVQSLVAHLFRSYNLRPNEIIARVLVPPAIAIHPDQAVLCGLIINELVTNALKHGFLDDRQGEVSVQITVNPSHGLTLAVSNSGDSLPADFDLQALQSVGLNLVLNLVQQLKGILQLDRGDCTIFKVTFTPSA